MIPRHSVIRSRKSPTTGSLNVYLLVDLFRCCPGVLANNWSRWFESLEPKDYLPPRCQVGMLLILFGKGRQVEYLAKQKAIVFAFQRTFNGSLEITLLALCASLAEAPKQALVRCMP